MTNRHLPTLLGALGLMIAAPHADAAKKYTVVSPDGKITMTVNADDSLHYSVAHGNTPVVKNATVGMQLDNGRTLAASPRVKSARTAKVKEQIAPVVPMKFSTIDNDYNNLTLKLADGSSVEFRVFNNGVAHRFSTSFPDSINVTDEKFNVTFSPEAMVHLQQPGGFKTSYEEPYTHKTLAEWTADDRMSTLPVLVEEGPIATLVSETDLHDYPGMFLKGEGNGTFHPVFPKTPLKFGYDGDRSVKILEEAPYIARTAGSRTFPWRFMAIGTPDDIVTQTLSAQLATPCAIEDPSWIKPGKASWDWWNGAMVYGDDVDFRSGYNLDTYRYFIDFAAKHGIEYIIMDEGWAKTTTDPFTPNPDVDLLEIINYGKEKGVGVIVWLTWLTVENHLEELFPTLSKWGVEGVKIDFMDRSDQWMVNYYERVIKEAAKHNMLVDFHGAFKPSGLEVTYPNLISYEGVRGMEQMGGCRPQNSVYLPLLRNAVGPMDYTPGAMLSMQPEIYYSNRPNSASIGTRAYQMALFVVFESGLQMLADTPTNYYRNPDCAQFISSVPVTWDETVVIGQEPGKYIAIAKRKGDKWYIGAINATNDTAWTDLALNLDFLTPGKTYTMTSFSDGVNAPVQALDYRKATTKVDSVSPLNLHLARNGGFCAVIEP